MELWILVNFDHQAVTSELPAVSVAFALSVSPSSPYFKRSYKLYFSLLTVKVKQHKRMSGENTLENTTSEIIKKLVAQPWASDRYMFLLYCCFTSTVNI